MPYLLFLKKQQNLKLSSAVLYGLRVIPDSGHELGGNIYFPVYGYLQAPSVLKRRPIYTDPTVYLATAYQQPANRNRENITRLSTSNPLILNRIVHQFFVHTWNGLLLYNPFVYE